MHLRFFQQCSLEPWKTDLRDGVWGSISTSPWHHDIKIIQHRHKLAVLFVPFHWLVPMESHENFSVGSVGTLLTTVLDLLAGVSWCVYPYEDHQLLKIWWLLRIHVRGGTVTYHLNVPSPPILLVQPLRSRTFHHLFVTQLWSALVLARKDQDV